MLIGFTLVATERKNRWKDPLVCRAFFDSYAKTNQFDPLNRDNWYKTDVRDVMLAKVRYT